MTKIITEKNRALENAKAAAGSLREDIMALRLAYKKGKYEFDGEVLSSEEIEERLQERPLSVQVRSDWHNPGDESSALGEYNILLSWGGPACRLIGELDEYSKPFTVRLEYQDWGTPWTEYTDIDADALLAYVNLFYFGDN